MPAVNYERMLQEAIRNGAAPNQVLYWSRPVNWKDQTLTPNPDTIYFNPFYDTTNGPVVLEIPAAEDRASITGSVDDAWQCALDDVGPAGVDKGAGGKYLITPPGYKDKPPDGYIVLPSSTYRGFAILRSNFKSGSDAHIAAAVEYGKRIKIYPLKRSASDTVFVDVYDKAYDATMFRLYGLKKELFEKTWKLPDVEEVKLEHVKIRLNWQERFPFGIISA